MKIYLVDKQAYCSVTYNAAKAILCSGLQPYEWTYFALRKILMQQND